MVKPIECSICHHKFIPMPDKPGKYNECPNCAVETVERVAGVTIWIGKHTPVLILTNQADALEFNRSTRRSGVAPALAFSRKEDPNEPGLKKDSRDYKSRMNEKRRRKF